MSRFSDEADELRELALYQPIKVLVWGPGDPGPNAHEEGRKAYRKRLQIRDELRTRFPRSEVFFSEDSEMVQLGLGIHGGLLRKEALQASIADLVIMLDISRGAHLELDHFVPLYPWFRDKVHVFLPADYMRPRGLVKEVFEYLREDQVEGFTQAEFDACSVATVKAVEAALSVALFQMLRKH